MFRLSKSKNIGVFSKFDLSGGSEMRCIELANAISRYTNHKSYLLCEAGITDKLRSRVSDTVEIYTNVFILEPEKVDKLYELDHLIVVNTDSRLFSSLDYWLGKSEKHSKPVDLSKIKQITFLYNYIVSPCKGLARIQEYCPDLRIITTNRKFFEEIGRKYEEVIHIPRMILESPIDPMSVEQGKSVSPKLRLGMHSKPVGDKWNKDWPLLVEAVHEDLDIADVGWRFMGCPSNVQGSLKKFRNIEFHKEFSLDVKDFLFDVDVFVFFPSYKREEPWSRSIAEGIMSGCPVLATPKGGNVDQIVHGNNGFLCKDIAEYKKAIVKLAKDRNLLELMRSECIRRSKEFSSKRVIEKLLGFIGVSYGS